MGRGKQESNKTYFKVSYEKNSQGIVDKDNGKPLFAEQKKEGDSWVNASEDTFLDGKIIGISQGSYEYKGKPQHTFEILIDGGDEKYALQLNYGYFTRSILNSLATIKDLGNTKLKFEIWRNKEGFVTVGVKDITINPDGERTEWLMEHGKLPKLGEEKWLGSFDYFVGIIKANIPEQLGGGENDDILSQEIAHAESKVEGLNESQTTDNQEVDDLPF